MKKVAGVIGVGVVGEAVLKGLKKGGLTVHGYDKFKGEYNKLDDVLKSDVIFVCVPTPTDVYGKQNLDALTDTFEMLNRKRYKGIVVIKSTILPGTTAHLAQKYMMTRVCHNPEFLTAAKPLEDFMNQTVIMISGPSKDTEIVAQMYVAAGFDDTTIEQHENPGVTEMAKYMHNVFLASKVSIWNEFYEVCQKTGVDFNSAREAAINTGNIGANHTKVPGPDGKLGYSGACFPKDSQAFLTFMKGIGLHAEMTQASVDQNDRVRPGNKTEFKGTL